MTIPKHTPHIASPPTANDYRSLAAALESLRRPLLVSHARPDGDALGCLLAMQSMLRTRGLDAYAVLYDACPDRYLFMDDAAGLHVLRGPGDPVPAGADGVLILDTCSWGQLEPIADWLRDSEMPRFVMDHHATRDDVGEVCLLDEQASAASLMVYELAEAAGWNIPAAAARAIFVGIVTDTGWFRYSNTTPRCLHVAADLIERGVDADAMHQHLYLSDPASMLRARGAALAAAEFHQGESVCVMAVSRKILEGAKAVSSDLEELVGIPLAVASVQLSALLVEMDNGVVKCSLRSKGNIDVARLAEKLGGGGHPRAAGVRIQGTLDAAKSAILNAIPKSRS